MRKIVIFTVLITLLSCQCTSRYYTEYQKPANPFIVSARVGEAVDLEERDKFGLFQGIKDFKEAKFYSSAGGGYEVQIETETQKLIVLVRSSNEFLILREYIDRYEEIQESREEFEAKWQIVDYDDSGFPITVNEVNRHRGVGSSALACCGTGTVITGLSLLVALGIAMSDFITLGPGPSPEEKRRNSFTATIVLIAGTALGVLLGVLVGNSVKKSISEEEALKSVKEARKPHVVEYFSEKEKSDGE
jgi:hypothetical protein